MLLKIAEKVDIAEGCKGVYKIADVCIRLVWVAIKGQIGGLRSAGEG